MKKEKTKIREFLDVINDVKKVFEENTNSIPANEVEKVNMLFSEAEELILKVRHAVKMISFFIIVLFLFIISMGIFGTIDYNTINNDNYEKTLIISKLESSNRMLNKYIWGEKAKDIKQKDTITKFTYIIDNKGNVITYFDLNKSNDSLRNINYKKTEIIGDLESSNDMLGKYLWGEKSKYIKQKDTIKAYSYIVDNKGNVIPYFDLNKIKDSLRNINYNQEIEIGKLKNTLDAIKKYYGISINSKDNIIAPKLDSALMIYPHYKDKLKYDNIKKTWVIMLPEVKLQ